MPNHNGSQWIFVIYLTFESSELSTVPKKYWLSQKKKMYLLNGIKENPEYSYSPSFKTLK